MFEYNAKLVKVIDGDTIDVELDFGFALKQTIRLRLADIDTPELNDSDTQQRMFALAAKRFVQEALENKYLIVNTLKTSSGKERTTFGRYVAIVEFIDGEETKCLNEMLIAEGYAKRWES